MTSTAPIRFDDAGAYERYMGRWGRAVAPVFLDWLAAPRRARWLDVGCGTGILAEAIADLCEPVDVVGIDPSAEQIAEASRSRPGSLARFQVADAMALPFEDASFDVVASGLVINFVPDPDKAIAEMRRVVTPSGIIGGYVWNFVDELQPNGPLRRAMRALGIDVPAMPGAQHSRVDALGAMFERAGCLQVQTRTIEVIRAYESFDEFWSSQTPSFSPATKVIATLDPVMLDRLKSAVRESLAAENGRIEYAGSSARLRWAMLQTATCIQRRISV
jgi:ubiquinone/menaquinone biosynthesis C-methylase UbiE